MATFSELLAAIKDKNLKQVEAIVKASPLLANQISPEGMTALNYALQEYYHPETIEPQVPRSTGLSTDERTIIETLMAQLDFNEVRRNGQTVLERLVESFPSREDVLTQKSWLPDISWSPVHYFIVFKDVSLLRSLLQRISKSYLFGFLAKDVCPRLSVASGSYSDALKMRWHGNAFDLAATSPSIEVLQVLLEAADSRYQEQSPSATSAPVVTQPFLPSRWFESTSLRGAHYITTLHTFLTAKHHRLPELSDQECKEYCRLLMRRGNPLAYQIIGGLGGFSRIDSVLHYVIRCLPDTLRQLKFFIPLLLEMNNSKIFKMKADTFVGTVYNEHVHTASLTPLALLILYCKDKDTVDEDIMALVKQIIPHTDMKQLLVYNPGHEPQASEFYMSHFKLAQVQIKNKPARIQVLNCLVENGVHLIPIANQSKGQRISSILSDLLTPQAMDLEVIRNILRRNDELAFAVDKHINPLGKLLVAAKSIMTDPNKRADAELIQQVIPLFLSKKYPLDTEYLGTPLIFYAMSKECKSFFQLFIERQPNLNVVNKDGYSPLALAIENGDDDLARLITQQPGILFNDVTIKKINNPTLFSRSETISIMELAYRRPNLNPELIATLEAKGLAITDEMKAKYGDRLRTGSYVSVPRSTLNINDSPGA
jgi:hypothetical protein